MATLFQAGIQSTLRVATAGAGFPPASDFNNVIFDGNQVPLRVWNKGYLSIPPIPPIGSGGLAYPILQIDGSAQYTQTANPPLFFVLQRSEGASQTYSAWHQVPTVPFQRGGSQGAGGVITYQNRFFYGINFTDPNNFTDSGYPPVVYNMRLNFCILKNSG